MNTEEINKKLNVLEIQLKQVSAYYIPPDKKSTSTKMGFKPGIDNAAMVNWKKKRMEEIGKEIENLKMEK